MTDTVVRGPFEHRPLAGWYITMDIAKTHPIYLIIMDRPAGMSDAVWNRLCNPCECGEADCWECLPPMQVR